MRPKTYLSPRSLDTTSNSHRTENHSLMGTAPSGPKQTPYVTRLPHSVDPCSASLLSANFGTINPENFEEERGTDSLPRRPMWKQ